MSWESRIYSNIKTVNFCMWYLYICNSKGGTKVKGVQK